MKIDKEQKRLRAIKLRDVFFPRKCKCCGDEYALEKMWSVNRYGVNATCNTWYYAFC
jgi:aminoglycoside phosphotransferase (APT) family kinase protein